MQSILKFTPNRKSVITHAKSKKNPPPTTLFQLHHQKQIELDYIQECLLETKHLEHRKKKDYFMKNNIDYSNVIRYYNYVCFLNYSFHDKPRPKYLDEIIKQFYEREFRN